jgi:hypothetical protein
MYFIFDFFIVEFAARNGETAPSHMSCPPGCQQNVRIQQTAHNPHLFLPDACNIEVGAEWCSGKYWRGLLDSYK